MVLIAVCDKDSFSGTWMLHEAMICNRGAFSVSVAPWGNIIARLT